MPKPADKRRHHYVPVTYLNGFADQAGQVVAYPKDEPTRAFRSRPDRIAFERYYYAQVAPDRRRDHNTLEDLFSAVESAWPALGGRAGVLFQFVALLSVRVAAMRDAVDHGNLAAVFQQVKAIVGDTVPVCLHGNSPIPDPARLGLQADWLWF